MSAAGAVTIGLLLAAGRGRRMGGGKQLLDWPTSTGPIPMVAAACDVIAPLCERVYVTVGHDAEAVRDALGRRQSAVPLSFVEVDPDAPMFSAIRAGLRAIRDDRVRVARVVLHPGDQPVFRSTTSTLLDQTSQDNPDRAVMPEYKGKGGHPAIIPASMIDDIIAYDGDGGLRCYWERNADHVLRVPVDDSFVISDIDVPEAYARVRAATKRDQPPI
jgi:molybdenum cofactor cytidylyltransferase